jgi:hypothetical protein
MLTLLLPLSVFAQPYRPHTIGPGFNLIQAVHFDYNYYNEVAPDDGSREIRPTTQIQTQVGGSGLIGNIGWTQPGEWVQYTVNVLQEGTYRFEVFLASGAGEAGNVRLTLGGNVIGESESEDNRDWQQYAWHEVGVADLTAGENQILQVYFLNGATNFAAIRVTLDGYEVSVPYEGARLTISPGRSYIEAVHFDVGGYQENDRWDGQHALRPDANTQTEVGLSTFLGNIGWTGGGEFITYTVNVTAGGFYRMDAFLASGSDVPGNIRVYLNHRFIGETQMTSSPGWQDYAWHTVVDSIHLDQGTHQLRVAFPTGGVNFAALRTSNPLDYDPPRIIPVDEPDEPDEPEAPTATPTPAPAAPTPPPGGGGAAGGNGNGSPNVVVIVVIIVAVVAAVFVIGLVVRKRK